MIVFRQRSSRAMNPSHRSVDHQSPADERESAAERCIWHVFFL